MSIEFLCPSCHQKISADESFCGSQSQCPACNAAFVVPRSPQSKNPTEKANLIKISWWMIGVICLLSMIPGVGFLIWIIAGPILLATIVMSIIELTKGQKASGILVLLCSLIVAPIFIVLAPIVSTATAGAVIDSKSEKNSKNAVQESIAAPEQPVSSSNELVDNKKEESESPNDPFRKMGESISLKDSTWIVLEAKELGKSLPETMLSNAKHSEGRFVYVKFRVTNNTNKEESILFEPTIRDSKNRSFEQLADASLPNDEESIGLEPLPASIPKTFSAIFEVAEDSSDLLFMTRTFDPFGTQYVPVKLVLKSSDD